MEIRCTLKTVLNKFYIAGSGSIDEKLGYYETLESVDIESVAKRSIGDSPHNKHVKFSALGR